MIGIRLDHFLALLAELDGPADDFRLARTGAAGSLHGRWCRAEAGREDVRSTTMSAGEGDECSWNIVEGILPEKKGRACEVNGIANGAAI
jgi:hypothetical protein